MADSSQFASTYSSIGIVKILKQCIFIQGRKWYFSVIWGFSFFIWWSLELILKISKLGGCPKPGKQWFPGQVLKYPVVFYPKEHMTIGSRNQYN